MELTIVSTSEYGITAPTTQGPATTVVAGHGLKFGYYTIDINGTPTRICAQNPSGQVTINGETVDYSVYHIHRRPNQSTCSHGDEDCNGICYSCGAYVGTADVGRYL